MITGMFHSGITIDNLERSLAFYRGELGIEHFHMQVSDQPYLAAVTGIAGCSLRIAFGQVESDTSVLEIIEYLHPKGGTAGVQFGCEGAPHVCWEVDSLSAVYQRLLSKGARFLAPPNPIGEGPWHGAQGAFLLDPDGLLVELIEPVGSSGGDGRLIKMVHTGLVVSDLDSALRFLAGKLELRVTGRFQGESDYARHSGSLDDSFLQAAWLSIPNTEYQIELWQLRTPRMPPADLAPEKVGSNHFCFMVKDIQAAYRALVEQGVQFAGPPVESTAGINKGGHAIYFRGPDNIRFELFQGQPTHVA
jgi:catechol 2,3-dioxygenase-like lactoylglutathione lyase family enzyme